MKTTGFWFCLVIMAVCQVSHGAHADEPTKPNLILFFVDDFGQRDLSCYGSQLYETPHMDRLAADGMLFTDAYSAYPRCVPSRQGLLSGKYPCRVRFSADRARDREHQLPLSEVTFGEALKEHGYNTCYIGKWHLGKKGGDPGAQGFDTVIHAGSAGTPQSYFFPFPMEKGTALVNPVDGEAGDYLTDRLTDKAVEYIESRGDTPFLMVMAHYAVHTPLQAPESVTQKYTKKLKRLDIPVGGNKEDADFVKDRQGVVKTVQNNPIYAAMVERTDDSLGRILEAVKKAGMESNTAVILTSDHGGLSTRGLANGRPLATSNTPLRQGKGSIFEGGTRVPLIVKWPGHVKSGSTSGVQVTGTDHYPTMLQIAGVPLRPQQHVDGRSYRKASEGVHYQREGMFWYKWQARPDSTGDTRAISYVEGNYKVIQWLDEELVELFDLANDISEQQNLAAQMPKKTRQMLTTLHRIEQEVGNLREKGRAELDRRLQKFNERKSTAKPTEAASAKTEIEKQRETGNLQATNETLNVQVPRGPRLREIAPVDEGLPIIVGASSNARHLETVSGTILDREFGYVTPGNDFKQSYIHPEPGVWKWEQAELWIERCAENNQIMRLHSAISPQCSRWAKDDRRTSEELQQNLTEYVTAVCKKYNGVARVRWMDVVNETVTREGEWFGPREGNEKWENPWTKIGFDETHALRPPLYIKQAFLLANEHAPNIKLILNQHGSMEPSMWKKVKATVEYLRDQKIRIDGIGWQAHIDSGWEKDPDNVESLHLLIDWAHQRGLEFHVTENTVWMNKGHGDDEAGQAQTFRTLLDILIEHGKEGVVTWNVWQIRDTDTERAHLRGCLFDANGIAKEAYYAVQARLQGLADSR